MSKFQKRAIIDLDRFDGEIAAIIEQSEPGPMFEKHREPLLALFKDALKEGRRRLRQSHTEGASGRYIVRGHAYLTDSLLRRLFWLVKAEDGSSAGDLGAPGGSGTPPLLQRLIQLFQSRRLKKNAGVQFCLVATGGYGRGELAPFSDIDLLFLLPEGQHPKFRVQVEQMLYLLWDLGLEVGHAVRNIPECVEHAREELQILTSLLESRFLAGNRKLFKQYRSTVFTQVLLDDPEAFQRAKLVEQRKRHERFGNSMFYLEPNIKENPGGLRDIQTFVWISKYRYRVNKIQDLVTREIITDEEYRTFIRCREYLHRVRNALHYRAGRRDDRLTFSHQLDIAAELGYRDRPNMRGVEQFMRRYYQVAKQVGNLTQVLLQLYQEEQFEEGEEGYELLEDVFILVGDKVAVTEPDAFVENPVRLMRLFEVAQRNVKGIHPDAIRLVRRNLGLVDKPFRFNPEVNQIFLDMLTGRLAVGWVLREMNACQLLGRYIPEFGRIIGQSQHDLFHVFTVDEHTLLAVEALRDLRAGRLRDELPLSTQLMKKLRHPVVLYLGVLFHDIAKGRGGKHELEGAAIAFQICARMGLADWETQQVVWLVENHLIFSRTAFRRDINDPQTVIQFAQMVGNQSNLDLLLLLTVADIRAVGPGVWSDWKATLMRRLYHLTQEYFHRGLYPVEELARQAQQKRAAVLEILRPDFPEAAINQFLDRFNPDYFASNEADAIAEHFAALAGQLHQPLAVAFLADALSDTTTLLIYTQDFSGLLSKISGSLAAESANILFVNGNTTTDGMALDIFVFQELNGGAIVNEEKLERIEKTIRAVLAGEIHLDKLLAEPRNLVAKHGVFNIPPTVEWENDFSETHTVLEISALDRLGLLYAITREVSAQNVVISTANISTYGERAVDVFYLKDIFGYRLGQDKIRALTQNLLRILRQLETPPEAPSVASRPAQPLPPGP